MAKFIFRSKSHTVTACQFEDTPAALTAISELTGLTLRVDYRMPAKPVLKIDTGEFLWTARPGDWVIRWADGHIEVCNPKQFGLMYEPTDANKGVEV